MKIKKRYLATILAIIVTISIISLLYFKHRNDEKGKILTSKVEKCTISDVVEASGTINPINTVSVGSTVSGLIKEIYVDFNSEVKKGQILAQIDPATFEATVQQQQASINSARANLQKLLAEESMHKKTYTRYQNLYKKNFIAKSEFDQAESTYFASQAQIKQAKSQITQAEAQLKTAKTNLGYTKIVAPVDGTIISRKIDLGQPVAASFQAPELFLIAQDLTKMKIEVNVSEADIGKVKEGQEVIYMLDGYPDEEFKGMVSQVRLSPTTVSNVVTYTVIVNVENDDLKIKPGMTANVSIISTKKEDVLCVPKKALKVSLDDNRYEKTGVWVKDKGQYKRVEVELGLSDDDSYEIITDKIKEHDEVVTNRITKGKTGSSNTRQLRRVL